MLIKMKENNSPPSTKYMQRVGEFDNVLGEYPECVIKTIKSKICLQVGITYWAYYNKETNTLTVYKSLI